MSSPVLDSMIAPCSDWFRANAAHNRALRDELHARVAQPGLGGHEKNRERHIARGKLLPRERLERLLDAGSPFLELGQLAAFGMSSGDVPVEGIFSGIGSLSERQRSDERRVGRGCVRTFQSPLMAY